MKQVRERWTDEETERARKLMDQGANDATLRRELGRSICAVQERLHRVDTAILDARRDGACKKVPAEVIAAATKRAMAPRTVTGFVLGDPPIGYSALDMRRADAEASV